MRPVFSETTFSQWNCHPRSRLRLHGRGGPVRVQTEEERPVPAAPPERFLPAASLGVPQVVLTRRDGRQKVSKLPFGHLIFFGLSWEQILQHLAGGHIGQLGGVYATAVLCPARVRGGGNLKADLVSAADYEDTLAKLGHAVVRRLKTANPGE